MHVKYPVFQPGDPQLRVYLPLFWVAMLNPGKNAPSNRLLFRVHPQYIRLLYYTLTLFNNIIRMAKMSNALRCLYTVQLFVVNIPSTSQISNLHSGRCLYSYNINWYNKFCTAFLF